MSKRRQLLPFPGTMPVDYVLASALERRESMVAVAVVALDWEGNPHVTFSDSSASEVAVLGYSLQAAVLRRFQTEKK
jgi:hypothetical protein